MRRRWRLHSHLSKAGVATGALGHAMALLCRSLRFGQHASAFSFSLSLVLRNMEDATYISAARLCLPKVVPSKYSFRSGLKLAFEGLEFEGWKFEAS